MSEAAGSAVDHLHDNDRFGAKSRKELQKTNKSRDNLSGEGPHRSKSLLELAGVFRRPSNYDLRFNFLKTQALAEISALKTVDNCAASHLILDKAEDILRSATEISDIWHARSLLIDVTPPGDLRQKISLASAQDAAIGDFVTKSDSNFEGDASGKSLRQLYRSILDMMNYKELKKEMILRLRTAYYNRLLIILLWVFLLFMASMIFLISGAIFGIESYIFGEDLAVVGFFRVFTAVICAGVFGAGFSLLVSGRDLLKSDDLEALEVSYRLTTIGMRLAVGTSGALILYFLYNTGIVQSDLFPQVNQISFEKVALGASGVSEAISTNKELGKLFIWSFLAGFSERLAPDLLTAASAEGPKSRSAI